MTQIVDQIVETENKQIERFNPFPGLRPFSMDESHLFFGREGQSDEILSMLSDNKFCFDCLSFKTPHNHLCNY